MMRLLSMKAHWTPEEATSLLTLLDELRDVIWANYRDDIIEYCHQQDLAQPCASPDGEDDPIPF